MPLDHPILVVSYQEEARAALEASLRQQEVSAVCCASFLEAENHALKETFHGILVDLASMVKAKGEEKVVACSLTGFYPTLRVRAVGSMLVPMIMPGGGPQEKSLKDFLVKACAQFTPRALRAHRRHELCLPAVLRREGEETRSFTADLSWGGAFLVELNPERYAVGDELELFLPDFELSVGVTVRWVRNWGGRRTPGIGCRFGAVEGGLEAVLAGLLKTAREQDRDRLVA